MSSRDADGRLVLLASWTVSRLVLFGLALSVVDRSVDMGNYRHWGSSAVEGEWPGRTGPWEYPPAAAAPMALAAWLGGDSALGFKLAFCGLLLLADAAVAWVLVRTGTSRHRVGAWAWILAVPALGPLAYQRFDLLAVLLTVTGLVLADRRPRTAAATLCAAVAVKLWPALVLAALVALSRARRSVLLTAAAAGVGTTAVLVALGFSYLTSSLAYQRDRGVQVESVAATVLHWLRLSGQGDLRYVERYGAAELVASWTPHVAAGVQVVAAASLAVALGALVVRVRKPLSPATLPLWSTGLVLLFLVVDKALSPQYLTWVAGTASVAASVLPARRALRLAAPLVAACAATTVGYPLLYDGLLASRPAAVVALTFRNVLLLWILAVLALDVLEDWRGGNGSSGTGAERPDEPACAHSA